MDVKEILILIDQRIKNLRQEWKTIENTNYCSAKEIQSAINELTCLKDEIEEAL